ncbi:diacylglycerol kinase [Cellvibrio sp. QJXJ]|uniref:diacylglycerol kinase n=1 Tax=Cellvibrio sp. QJXJ TaxID=2964606 RepID=UPI0021C2EEC7|nr:diacylglycerol kinase [Cellvibrio sp. QJXJ]UUA72090.1 diacylglycerol kinase [Cellvibrio sp. QJXJ]
MKSSAQGFKRLYLAARYSWQGFKSGWRSEAAIRQEVVAACILVPSVFFLDITNVERAVLMLSVLMVLIVELLNTGIEMVVDRIGSEFHELSGKAKDLGSCAVLMSLLAGTATWAVILWP